MSSRPSGLAVVAYGLTLVGFVQVAVTIAPHVANTIPAAGNAAPAVGVAVALAIDVCWAALGHTTIHAFRTGQRRPALGFGAATGAAVLASTVLLAAVGHMGPWSVVPILAALLLVADGIRELVTVSAETAATIRARSAEIRDQRALAVIEARHAAHLETLAGHGEAARLAARTGALADIKVTVRRAEHRAQRRIETATARYGEAPIEPIAYTGPTVLDATRRDTKPATPATPATSRRVEVANDDELDNQIRDMVSRNIPVKQIAVELGMHRATAYRRVARIREAS